MKPTIVIGADHGGYRTKETIKKTLAKAGYNLVDVGGFDPNKPDDYPDYARLVAKDVAKGKDVFGVLVCGTGTGMVMAANRHKGVRAALIYDRYTATMARHDNDANIAAIRGRKFSARKAAGLVKLFIETPFSGIQRHQRRIRKIDR